MALCLKPFNSRIGDNDLRLLRIFATVVRHGGFAQAESELQIGLPTISRYIKDLEIRLGVRLCDRGRRGFALTNEGVTVFEACGKLFDDLEAFESAVRDMHANPAGALQIGLIDALISAPDLPLASAINRFKAAFPNVYFNIAFMTANKIEQDVMEGRLELGIVFERRPMDRLKYHFLYEEVSHLYATIDHPLHRAGKTEPSDEDLTGYEYVSYPFAMGMGKVGIEDFMVRTATVNHVDAIALMIQSGSYMGFLPDHYVQTLKDREHYWKVAPDRFHLHSRISAITHQGALSGLIPLFIGFLEEAAAAARAKNSEP